MKTKKILFFLSLIILVLAQRAHPSSSKRILIFAGSASKPATEEMARLFQDKSGISVNITFGGSGFVLSQIELAKRVPETGPPIVP